MALRAWCDGASYLDHRGRARSGERAEIIDDSHPDHPTIWNCEHLHDGTERAIACAKREIARRASIEPDVTSAS